MQNENRRLQFAYVVVTNDVSEQSVVVLAYELAKFSLYHQSLNSNSTPLTTLAESGKPYRCLISFTSKWVIDFGAINHMIGNSSLFSTFNHTFLLLLLPYQMGQCVLGSGIIHPTPLIPS